jgi:hypothetical protein
MPEVKEAFAGVIAEHVAGDPMQEGVVWTNFSLNEISRRMSKSGTAVSSFIVKQLVRDFGMGRRKARKRTATGKTDHRNEQFEYIAQLKQQYFDASNPVVSMDTKKKEYLGNLYRDGQLYTTNDIEVYDHDFLSLTDGVLIPHGIYDLARNVGHINLGLSHDTSEFACDSLGYWWRHFGCRHYPRASSLLVLCDAGGSHDARFWIFKEDLQKLANRLGMEIRIAHYPPYCSKYTPIDHRFFPHVTRALQGVILRSVELVKHLIRQTRTTTGLRATVHVIRKMFETERKPSSEFRENPTIIFDSTLPQWNYKAVPLTV